MNNPMIRFSNIKPPTLKTKPSHTISLARDDAVLFTNALCDGIIFITTTTSFIAVLTMKKRYQPLPPPPPPPVPSAIISPLSATSIFIYIILHYITYVRTYIHT